MKYKQVAPGEWVQPIRRGYKMLCCDCGLVHTVNFRLAKSGDRHWIQFQAFRDEKATAAAQREKRKKAEAA